MEQGLEQLISEASPVMLIASAALSVFGCGLILVAVWFAGCLAGLNRVAKINRERHEAAKKGEAKK